MKNVLVFVVVLVVLIVGGTYVAYGALEPCKVLAIEQARRAGTPDKVDENATAQMSSTACAGGLVSSWMDRLKATMS